MRANRELRVRIASERWQAGHGKMTTMTAMTTMTTMTSRTTVTARTTQTEGLPNCASNSIIRGHSTQRRGFIVPSVPSHYRRYNRDARNGQCNLVPVREILC